MREAPRRRTVSATPAMSTIRAKRAEFQARAASSTAAGEIAGALTDCKAPQEPAQSMTGIRTVATPLWRPLRPVQASTATQSARAVEVHCKNRWIRRLVAGEASQTSGPTMQTNSGARHRANNAIPPRRPGARGAVWAQRGRWADEPPVAEDTGWDTKKGAEGEVTRAKRRSSLRPVSARTPNRLSVPTNGSSHF